MGRRGRAAGGPSRSNNGIILEFAKPNQVGANTTSSATSKKIEQVPSGKVLPRSQSCSPVYVNEAENLYEKCTSKSCDKESVECLINSWNKAITRRADFHKANINPNYEEFDSLRRAKKLDSTLKRCNTFVKKLKNCTGQVSALESELSVLNLTKFMSEICSAISENLLKDPSHVWDILSICSSLHQRYNDFSSSMLEIYKGKFSTRLSENDWNNAHADLRLVTELVICGILGDEGFPVIYSCLRQLLVVDKETGARMSLMLLFVKEFGLEVCGIFPKSAQILCDTFSIPMPSSDLVQTQKAVKITFLIQEYITNIGAILTKLHEEVNQSELVRRKILRTKGEVSKDREDVHKELVANFDRFHGMAKVLCFYADSGLPELQSLPPDEDDQLSTGSEGFEVEASIRSTFFDDEETRSFYQDLPDLTKYLTSSAKRENLLILEKQAAAIREAEADVNEELEIAELQSDLHVQTSEVDLIPESDQPIPSQSNESLQDEEKSDQPIPPKYNEYLLSLHQCVNRNMVDAAAEMFMLNFNTKPNRKKLIKQLNAIPRQRVDLLPLWSRFIAVLNPVIPDLGAEVVDFLSKQLRHLIKRCHPTFIETKLKIIRYIAELVNFEIFPPVDAFSCLRILLVNFANHQLEMACAFVECCGRYMHKNPATRRRMKLYLDQMMRKKQVKVLTPRHSDLVEQAYYAVFPSEGGFKVKRISLMEAFLREVVVSNLNRKTKDATIEVLRRLNWDNSKTFFMAIKVFCQPWKIATNQFSIVCSVLSSVQEHQERFGVCVADTVMCLALQGLKSANTLNNQHLVCLVEYIGELFCYEIFSYDSILQLMYALITNGVSFNYKRPTPLDPPRSTFRIRLVTVLLKGCGDYFLGDKYSKEKLKHYLQYLQRYMYFKRENPTWGKKKLPYLYEPFYVVVDLISHLFPTMVKLRDYEHACERVATMESLIYQRYEKTLASMMQTSRPPVASVPILSNIQECEENENNITLTTPTKNETAESTIGTEDSSSCHPTTYNPIGIPVHKWITATDYAKELEEMENENLDNTPEESFDFDLELEKMVVGATRGTQRTHVAPDIRIPMNLQRKKSNGEGMEKPPKGTIPYAILLKKGNKSNIKHVDVPENAEFVKRMRQREITEREERAQRKERTLRINRMQIHEEMMMEEC